MPTTLPGLQPTLQYGYDTTRGAFAANAVFDLSYEGGGTIVYNKATYDVPDGVRVTTNTRQFNSSSTVLLKTKADYDDYYSASISASGTATNPMTQMSFTGSVQSQLAFHGSLFQSATQSYALDFGRQQVYTAARSTLTAKDYLTTAFKSALGALGSSSTPADYFAFFDAWGTHYLTDGIFGGFYTMQTTIDDSLFETSTLKSVEAGVQAGFTGVVASGTLDASAAYQSSTWLSQNRSSTQVTIWTNGGGPTGSSSINDFFNSLFENPLLLLFLVERTEPTLFRPLSDFCATPEAQASFDAALRKYLDRALRPDGVLGSPEPRKENTVYPVRFDGFVTSVISSSRSGDRGIIEAFSDATGNPKILRGAASMHDSSDGNNFVSDASLTTPLRRGDHFQVQYTNSHGITPSRIELMPFGFHTDVRFGAWQEVPLDAPQTAAADCFVVGIINCPDGGPRGNIQGQQMIGGAMTTVVASSAHLDSKRDCWVRCESFCMPVPRNTQYKVGTYVGSGAPAFSAYALPVEGGHPLLGAFEARDPGTNYHAETDGFLVAYIDASSPGARALAWAYVARITDDLTKVPPRAFTSAHSDNKGKDKNTRWIPYNAFTAPVEKGSWYQVKYQVTAMSPKLILHWVPLLQPLVVDGAAQAAAGAPTSRLVSNSG
jgi:hypothetical protein